MMRVFITRNGTSTDHQEMHRVQLRHQLLRLRRDARDLIRSLSSCTARRRIRVRDEPALQLVQMLPGPDRHTRREQQNSPGPSTPVSHRACMAYVADVRIPGNSQAK